MSFLGRNMASRPAGRDENQALPGINLPVLLEEQAPVEYSGIGSSLSPHRRREIAASGSMRHTAEKLAALFDTLIPEVPKLIAAYGTRASEILQNRHVNPEGAEHLHGPFAAFVGADAASIWAAATSGGRCVAIHLLACLLARACNDPAHSVSVWDKVVLQRQKEIAKSSQETASSPSMVRLSISREELRIWDASARAWLRTADLAMKNEQVRLQLILKGITLPISCGDVLYADVIQSWTYAMRALEGLLCRRPHTTTDGATLLGISSWHIYPNLLLLGPEMTEIGFSDSLFPASCFLAIDITGVPDDMACRSPSIAAEGVQWPPLLSQHKIKGSSSEEIGIIDSRVNIDELYVMALGSLLGTWNVPESEIEPSIKWFIALWASISNARSPLPKLKWIENIAMAAKRLLEAVGSSKEEYQYLVNFGYRHGRNFLIPSSQREDSLPWFGLRHWHILTSLGGKTAGECGVRYLRQLARAMGLRYDEAIITQISHENLSIGKKEYHQYTTALKVPLKAHEAPIDSDQDDIDDVLQKDDGTVPDLVPDDPVQSARKGKKKAVVDKQPHHHRLWEGTFTLHDEYSISKLIEEPKKLDKYRPLQNPLSMAEQLVLPLHCYRVSDCPRGSVLADCQAYLRQSLDLFPSAPVDFTKMLGDSTGALRLWLTREAAANPDKLEEALGDLQAGKGGQLISIDSSIDLLASGRICPDLLWQYLEGPDPYEPEALIKPFLEICRKERQRCEPIITSLRSLVVAQSIYKGLDGASVSSSIIKRGIHDAKWAELYHLNATISRSVVFGCIAMLDTGIVNLESQGLEEVFALSSGNSLYVVSRILSDPSIEVPNHAVSHIVGNIGRHGVSLLVSPTTRSRVRPTGEVGGEIKYEPFHGRREDRFKKVSLRLEIQGSYSDYGVDGVHDNEAFFIESVVSVYDGTMWIADLDIQRVLDWEAGQHRVSVARVVCSMHSSESRCSTLEKFVAVDSWEEVLGNPPAIGLVRAYKNWPARLAVAIVLARKGVPDDKNEMEIDGVTPNVAVLDHGDNLCWTCVYRRLRKRVQMASEVPTFLIA